MADDLCCSICMFRFNESSYQPLWLKCGHTFCKSCLEDIATRGKLKCPVCNCEESSSVSALPKNFIVLEMIVRGVLSRTSSSSEEPWICKLHPPEQLTFYSTNSKIFLCSECVKLSNDPKIVAVDKHKVKGMLKPYANFYEAATVEDMDARLTFVDQLERCIRGEEARLTMCETHMRESADLTLAKAYDACRNNLDCYYEAESTRLTSSTKVLKCLRDLRVIGTSFEITTASSVAKQMELIPPLMIASQPTTAPAAHEADSKYAYRLPRTAMQASALIALAGSRVFTEASSGEDVCEYKLSRFSGVGSRWGIYEDKNQVEAFTFTVSKSVFLTAISVGTCFNVGKTATVHELAVIQGSSTGGYKMASETGIVVANVDNAVKTVKLQLTKPVELSAFQDYTVRLVAKSEAGMYRGANAQQVVSGPKQVEFTFKSAKYVPNDIKNGDNETDGPIFDLYYTMSPEELVSIARFRELVPGWTCNRGCKDAVSFQTDKNAKLYGVTVGAPTQAGPAMLTVEVVEGPKTPGKLILALPSPVLLPFCADNKTVRVMFAMPVAVRSNEVYTVQVGIGCPSVFRGVEATGVVAMGGLRVVFRETLYEGAAKPNGANAVDGPIAELLFSDISESDNLYGTFHAAIGPIDPLLSDQAGAELRLQRFSGLEPGWEVQKGRKEALTFRVDRRTIMTGFGLASAQDSTQPIAVTSLRLLCGASLTSPVMMISTEPRVIFALPDSDPVHRVPLPTPIELFPGRPYTLLLSIEPVLLLKGVQSLAVIEKDAIVCRFEKTALRTEDNVNSGEAAGPICDLYLVPADCWLENVRELIGKVFPDRLETPARQLAFTRYAAVGSSWHVNGDGKQVEAITFKPSFSGHLSAIGVGNAHSEGASYKLKNIELRQGAGTRGDVLYQHPQTVVLRRSGKEDTFVKVPLARPVLVSAGEFYTLRVQYQENAVVVRGTSVTAVFDYDGVGIEFQRANFEGGDVENGNHEVHGPLRDFFFLIG